MCWKKKTFFRKNSAQLSATYMNCSNLNKPSGRLFYVGTKRVGAYSRVGTY